MNRIMKAAVLCLMAAAIVRADVQVISVKGDVQVRRSMSEEWSPVAIGDILKPDDSIRSGRNSKAVIVIDGQKKITLPELAIVDCSDLKKLSQEELLLMLAMEQVRSVPARNADDDFSITKTTTVHGENKDPLRSRRSVNPELALLQLNGTKVLYDQGYYATCVLRAKEIFRLNPVFLKKVNFRLVVADALEKMKLRGEALSEYNALKGASLTPEQRSLVEEKISQLKKKSKG